MPVAILRISAAVLAVAFTWSALAKLARFDRWRTALARYGLPQRLEVVARALVPVAELLVPAGVVAGLTRAAGALSVCLLGVFSLAILRARAEQGDRLPCGCFGKLSERDYRAMLVRNVALATPAALIMTGRDVSLFEDLGIPAASDALPIALVVVAIAIMTWLVRSTTNMTGNRR